MKQAQYEKNSKKSEITDKKLASCTAGRPAFQRIAGLLCFFLLLAAGQLRGDATVHGLSGTMLVPGLEILPPGGARAAIHFTGENDFDEATFKGVFAFSEDSEVAIVKKTAISGVVDQTDPVFAGKYKVRPNMAVAAIIDPNEGNKDSVMLLSGMPGNRVVLGVGTNVAMNEREKKSSFGRYDKHGIEADPLFFIMGASLNIDAETRLTLDYAGNDFCIGVRHAFDEALTFDFGYYTPDRIHPDSRYIVGANFGF